VLMKYFFVKFER